MDFPKILHCIVCEDVRREVGRKASLMGFYGIIPYVSLLLLRPDLPLRQLGFLFVFDKATENLAVSFRIRNPEGETLAELPESEVSFPEHGKRSQLFVVFQNLTFPTFGNYSVDLISEKQIQFRGNFEVMRGTPKDFA